MPPKQKKLDSSSPDGKLRVLSLDGGGFRGLGMLYSLDAVVKAANNRNRETTDPQLKPHDIFDFVCGASAGGLVGVLVGRLGLDCATAISEYKKLATALFGTSRADFVQSVLTNKQLDATAYKAAVEALVAKYSPASPNFYSDPVINAKTAVSVLPYGKTVAQSVASFQGGLWSMQDLIRAATAALRYLSPVTPRESSTDFVDAAYGGQAINPTALAIQRKYFDPANVGVLVNIGQGFADVQLPNKATLQQSDAAPFRDIFLGGVTDTTNKADATVLFYLKHVQNAQKAWTDKLSKDKSFSAGALQRLDPPSVPSDHILDLADIFLVDKIEPLMQQWVLDNNATFTEIAKLLVKADELTPEPATDKIPYNPALDAKKPKEMLEYLSTYHVIFIIDDSTSMILKDDYSNWNDSPNNRWNQAQRSIGPIAQFAFDKNIKSVDMGFLHYQRNNPVVGIQSRKTAEDTFNRAKPPRDWNRIQYTPTGGVLDFYLKRALDELDAKAKADLAAYKQIRPTDIIMLTDGEADDDPKGVIMRARQRMDAGKHNHNYIGIQFVQIGESNKVKLSLQEMTKGEYGDMADLVASDGTDLTPEKLTRIMLGGIHPSVRRKLRAEDLQ